MAVWIPAAIAGASAIGSLASQWGNRKTVRNFNKRADLERGRSLEQMRNSSGMANEYTGDIRDAAERAYGDANQSLEERFGRQLASTQDRIQGNAAMSQNVISQALMARGGDLTGQGAGMMLGVNQQGNEAQSDAINQYKTMTDRMNAMDKNRGDMMLARALQGAQQTAGRDQQQFQFASNQKNQGDMLDIQRRAARSQAIMDTGATSAGLPWT